MAEQEEEGRALIGERIAENNAADTDRKVSMNRRARESELGI